MYLCVSRAVSPFYQVLAYIQYGTYATEGWHQQDIMFTHIARFIKSWSQLWLCLYCINTQQMWKILALNAIRVSEITQVTAHDWHWSTLKLYMVTPLVNDHRRFIDSYTNTYCSGDNDAVPALWHPMWRTVFLHLVPCIASCEASLWCNAHILAIVTEFAQPLLLRYSFGAMTACLCIQEHGSAYVRIGYRLRTEVELVRIYCLFNAQVELLMCGTACRTP